VYAIFPCAAREKIGFPWQELKVFHDVCGIGTMM
jgi:hypothetical protein